MRQVCGRISNGTVSFEDLLLPVHANFLLKLESEYVKNHLEGVLTELLAELYLIRPADPIEWLSCALRQYARREEARKGRSEPSNSEPADGTALTTE